MTVNVSKPRQVAYADQVCNPNMIINWNFQNIINQRGQLEYPLGDMYIFDTWHKSSDTKVYLRYDNGRYSVEKLEILTSLHGFTLKQENELIENEMYTLTIEIENLADSMYVNFGGVDYNVPIKNGINIISGKADKEPANYKLGDIYIWGGAGVSFKPIGIKVERGAISTYKNEVFNYTETLRKCQRYYLRLTAHADRICYVGLCQAYNTSYAIINLPYDLRMHTPTVTYGGNFYLTPVTFTAPTRLLVTSIGVNGSAPEGKGVVLLIYADGIIDGTVYKLIFEPGGYIDFSAEL